MNILKEIEKVKKMKGISWNTLAENLPISGNGLRLAFSRNSVDDVYIKEICKVLEIQNEQKTQNEVSEEPETYTLESKKIEFLHADLKKDLKTIYDGLSKNFNVISEGVFETLKGQQKILRFIDELDADKINKASSNLNEFLKTK